MTAASLGLPGRVAGWRLLAAGALALVGVYWLRGHLRFPGLRGLERVVAPFSEAPALAAAEPLRPPQLWLGDFEDQEALDGWQLRGVEASLSNEHASHGARSVALSFPVAQDPAFLLARRLEQDAALADWSGYERLELDLFNPQDAPEWYGVQLKDAHGGAFKEKLLLAPGARHVSIRIGDLAGSLDLSQMAQLSLYRWRPTAPARVFLDAVRLEGRQAEVPLAQALARPQLAPLAGTVWLSDFEEATELGERWSLRGVSASVSEEGAAHGQRAARVRYPVGHDLAFLLEKPFGQDPRLADWSRRGALAFELFNAESFSQGLGLQLRDSAGHVYKEHFQVPARGWVSARVPIAELKPYLDVARIAQFNLYIWNSRAPATFLVDAVRLEPPSAGDPAAAPPPRGIASEADWSLAWAPSLIKVFREPSRFDGEREGPARISLARHERESFQVVVVGGREAAKVRVEAGPIHRDGGGGSIAPAAIDVRRVGYVTTRQPYYPVPYVGEWPDPLPPAGQVEVAAGALQPVWVTVAAADDQPAGLYHGRIRVVADDGRARELALEVRVWDFELPRTPSLPTAFDFSDGQLARAYRSFVPGGSAWDGRIPELEQAYYFDMLQHRISPVIGVDPAKRGFDDRIEALRQRGLVAFGLFTRGGSNDWPDEADALERRMARYREGAAVLRREQLLGAAYVYAWDEPTLGLARVAGILEALHAAASDLRTLICLFDAPDPLRHAEWLKDADILCVRNAAYDAASADAWRRQGKQVWMYPSSPTPPFPTLVIDAPAISYRILPWMCWKYRAQGLLYWHVNYWSGEDPWRNPATFAKDQNGNGSLYYPAPDGPVPSIRLEVLRDGLDDYDYLETLKQRAAATTARGGALPDDVRRLLEVDAGLIASPRSYAKDPAVLLARRTAMAEAIERLGGGG